MLVLVSTSKKPQLMRFMKAIENHLSLQKQGTTPAVQRSGIIPPSSTTVLKQAFHSIHPTLSGKQEELGLGELTFIRHSAHY